MSTLGGELIEWLTPGLQDQRRTVSLFLVSACPCSRLPQHRPAGPGGLGEAGLGRGGRAALKLSWEPRQHDWQRQ